MNLFLEVKFKGGLGNQLFQYATGRSLALKRRIPYLLLNTESYHSDPFGRGFGLQHFRIKGSVVQSPLTRKLFRKGTGFNRSLSALSLYKGIEESELKLHYFPTHSSLVTSLSGYWQSDFYFKDIRATLVKELVPTAAVPAFPDWQRRENTVAVHIRRTDYLVENGFGPLSEKYYRDAILMIRSRVKDPVFIFFSDDIGWCKQQFIAEDFLFCEEAAWDKDYLQLFLMSTCKHQIIANSSFSWWGGWLNANPDKLVIRPEKPFANNALMYESYYPVDWLSIKNQLE